MVITVFVVNAIFFGGCLVCIKIRSKGAGREQSLVVAPVEEIAADGRINSSSGTSVIMVIVKPIFKIFV